MRLSATVLRLAWAFCLTLTLLSLTTCHASHAPLRHGCFNPAPRKSVTILKSRGPQLRWPSAHRGDREAAADNSLAALQSAVRRSMPLIEVDVRVSADGKLLLFHDRRLRPENFEGPAEFSGREVQTLSWAELSSLRHPGKDPQRILSLAEAFETVRSYPTALQLDLKGESPALAASVIELARLSGALDNIVVQCQSVETARFIRMRYPNVAVLVRADGEEEVSAALDLVPVPEIIQVDREWLNASLIERIQSSGSHVLVKTLDKRGDTPAHWLSLIERGVDIVITDYPRQFLRSIPRSCEAR